MKILVNQVGYEADGPVLLNGNAVLQGEKGESVPSCPEFLVVEASTGETAFGGTGGTAGTVPGWKDREFSVLDFSRFAGRPGEYFIRINHPEGIPDSPVFTLAPHILVDTCASDLLFYLKSQRSSGIWDTADRNAPYFGGRTGRIDVHGGWFDASGDYSKYLSHLSYAHFMNPQQTPLVVWALGVLGDALEKSPGYRETLLVTRAREEAAWGADFLVRMQDPRGYFYMTVFDQWDKKPESRMICSYRTQKGERLDTFQAGFRQGGGMAVAALARASTGRTSGEYSPEDYLEAARKGWAHLADHNGEYSGNGRENIIDHYCALTAAAELYAATGSCSYLDAARQRAERLSGCFSADRQIWLSEEGESRPFWHAAEAGFPVVALHRYREVEPDEGRRAEADDLIHRACLAELAVTRAVFNPFYLARQTVQELGEDVRTSFFIPHNNESGYWWQGENARLASLSCAAGLTAALLEKNCPEDSLKEDLKVYARAQLDWILGKNPFDMCMLQGRGRNNPKYEDHYPNAPGGICNGITAGYEDEGDIDFLPASVAGRGDHRWRWSEQWIPHAGWFLLALAANLQG